MTVVRTALGALVLTAVTSSVLVTAPVTAQASGAVAAERAQSCDREYYRPTERSATAYQDIRPAAVITQLGARTIPPGGGREVTFTVADQTNFTAGATVSGSYSAKVGNAIIGKAEAKMGLELSASGSKTKRSSTTVREYVKNTTGRNQKYVGFRGTLKVAAGLEQSYCSTQGTSRSGTVKWRRVGSWQTFTFVDEGTARCGAGATGAVAKKALSIGCR